MKQLRSIRFAAAAALVLCVCLLLTAGIAYGRYRSGVVESVSFAVQQPEQLWLWQQTDAENPEFVPMQDGIWTSVENGTQVLRFQVSNGKNKKNAAQADILANVAIEASLGVGDPTWLYMTISTTDEKGKELTYLAVPEKIVEGSLLHAQLGEGWRYSFYPLTEQGEVDFTKDPLQWSFPGGKYTTRQAELRITGAVDAPTLLRLSVSQAQPDENDT